MKNEYGVKLDRNGYAPSLVFCDGSCAICGRHDRALQRHEAFHGANRDKSKRLGCWLYLCYECHDRLHHHDAAYDLYVKRLMQEVSMNHYHWTKQDFIREWGRSYLDE